MGPYCAFTGLRLALPARLTTRHARCGRVHALAGEGGNRPEPVLLTRRAALSLTALLALSSMPMHVGRVEAEDEVPAKQLALPPLPYAYNSVEPAIDKETMILHHDKHFAKYTEGANAALAKIPGAVREVNGNPANLAALLARLDSVKDEQVRLDLRNNGGGYLNHFQYFATLTAPDEARAAAGPDGDLALAIKQEFGGFDAFREEFTKKSLSLFGSGFVYLVKEMKNGGNLAVRQYANQDSPVMDGDVPLVGIDLWEHAYYKKYSNRRASYIDAWWTVVNWDAVSASFQSPASKS